MVSMELKKKVNKEQIINTILNIFIVIFGLILIFSVYNKIQVSFFGKDYSDFFGYSVFEVQTGSMKPEINPGDWIIVKATKNIELEDVVTYKEGEDFRECLRCRKLLSCRLSRTNKLQAQARLRGASYLLWPRLHQHRNLRFS